MTRPALPRRAITLIETLVLIGIIAIALGLFAVGIQKVRAMGAMAQCANNLKQVGLACHAAHDLHKRMPPAFGFYPGNDIYSGADGLGNVFFHLLPFVDQLNLYEQSHHEPVSNPQQDFYFYTANGVNQTQVPVFNCPGDPTLRPGIDPATNYAPSSYAANYLVFGNVDQKFANANAQGTPRLGVTFPDGTSNTILLTEKFASASIGAAANHGTAYKGGCHWAYFQADCQNPFFAFYEAPTDPNAVAPGHFQVQPNPASCNPCLPATGHAALNVCMGDGSVRSLRADMEPALWWALVTPAGGETVDSE
jgi:hypothetical protein